MFENKKYYIFDWDGTLVDSLSTYIEADKELIRMAGGTPSNDMNRDKALFFTTNNKVKNNFRAYIYFLKEKYNLSLSVEELACLREQLCKLFVRERTDLKPQADLFLRLLKDSGHDLFLATVSRRIDLNNILDGNLHIKSKCDIFDIFGNNILTNDDIENRKPHPEIYLKAMGILGAKPCECIVFEDSLSGITSAKEAGLEVVAVYDAYNDYERDQINALADYQIDSYNQLIEISNITYRKK